MVAGLLLRELAQRTGRFGRLSACFRDYREPQRTRHPVEVLVGGARAGPGAGLRGFKPNLHHTVTGLLHAIRGGVNTISPFFPSYL